jgi:hypothetical protein
MLNLLEDNFWRALVSIIALGSTVAAIVNFFKPIDANASAKEKIKRALLVLLIFCVVASGVILFIQKASYASVPAKNSTPRKALAALATGVPKQTVPAQATPSSSVPTQVIPTQIAHPATSQGSFIIPSTWTQKINDPLTTESQWVTDKSVCKLLSIGYSVTSQGPNYCNYDAPAHNFSDLAYSIVMTLHQGYMGGLVFRLNSDNYYGFYLTTKGMYQVLWHTNTDSGNDTSIDPANSSFDSFKFSSAIRQGLEQQNTLSVLAQGTSLQFYINGQRVSSVQDSTYSSGTIGVIIGDPKDQTSVTSATFNHAQVWTP